MRASGPTVATLATALLVTSLLAGPGIGSAFAEDLVTSVQLVEEPTVWDGRIVRIRGEVIGEAMERGNKTWLHVNDDVYALRSAAAGGRLSGFNTGMPVLVEAEEARKLRHFGSHREQGDVVAVTGIFRAADPDHGGEMLIDATRLEIERLGRPVRERVDPWKLGTIPALALACIVAGLLLRRPRHVL